MPTFIALVAASVVSYLPHALFGDHLSPVADVVSSLVVGSVAYVVVARALKRMRDGL